MKKIVIAIIIIVFLFVFWVFINRNKELIPNTTTSIEELENNEIKADSIVVETPTANSVLTNTFEIKGRARGYWFFESSFPVRLVAEDGTVLFNSYIMTDKEWMTEDFVVFNKTFTYKNLTGLELGTLILEKDNPSGLQEKADNLFIPVQLSVSANTNTIDLKAYFNKAIMGTESCDDIQIAVTRSIPQTLGVAKASILELLKGPAERENLTTSIPMGTYLNNIKIKNGTAYVDFNSTLQNYGGSCNAIAIHSQIEYTLKQFPTIKNVIISVNGQTEGILEP